MFDAVDVSTNILWTITKMDNEEESNNVKQEMELVAELPKVLLYCERMKRLSPYQLPLKEWKKDQTISYVDLLHLDPLHARLEDLVP